MCLKNNLISAKEKRFDCKNNYSFVLSLKKEQYLYHILQLEEIKKLHICYMFLIIIYLILYSELYSINKVLG